MGATNICASVGINGADQGGNSMNIIDILKDWLKTHDYDGLCNDDEDCGCGFSDFTPCGRPERYCTPGYKVPDPSREVDFLIVRGERMKTEGQKEKEFCEKLTELLHKYGFGIADEPHIYNLQHPYIDEGREASIDDENRLHFV